MPRWTRLPPRTALTFFNMTSSLIMTDSKEYMFLVKSLHLHILVRFHIKHVHNLVLVRLHYIQYFVYKSIEKIQIEKLSNKK